MDENDTRASFLGEGQKRQQNQPPFILSEWLRARTSRLTSSLGRLGVRLGLSPDALTLLGTLLAMGAAGLIAAGNLFVAGVVLLMAAPLDALDGAVARASGRTSRFGALLDSAADRYADGFLLLGLMFYFMQRGDSTAMLFSGLALIGAYMVSYVRARAEGLGIPLKEGLFSRLERLIVLIAALLTGLIVPGVIILAVGSHLTALQRIAAVYRVTDTDKTR